MQTAYLKKYKTLSVIEMRDRKTSFSNANIHIATHVKKRFMSCKYRSDRLFANSFRKLSPMENRCGRKGWPTLRGKVARGSFARRKLSCNVL